MSRGRRQPTIFRPDRTSQRRFALVLILALLATLFFCFAASVHGQNPSPIRLGTPHHGSLTQVDQAGIHEPSSDLTHHLSAIAAILGWSLAFATRLVQRTRSTTGTERPLVHLVPPLDSGYDRASDRLIFLQRLQN